MMIFDALAFLRGRMVYQTTSTGKKGISISMGQESKHSHPFRKSSTAPLAMIDTYVGMAVLDFHLLKVHRLQ